ncbi:hypothetical protein SLH49_05090 [Cognatiyoonia sp. IB215446]|uniref:hypothetical protein n=1 Tax=Cognatiyoonia sp. IB215446 TaxID=3097355 RepID=UPI002A10632A|nr:hypothetical protein [Cognatiyoonia sp. IB215446]MDX8347358.1 hypothetical protein [Cognatiyoonia sp. IB215446]
MVIDIIGLGDALALLTILGAAIGFFVSMHKDRQRRLREYATTVREAAALVTAKTERLARSYVHMFDSVQELFVDADAALVSGKEAEAVRDQLWRSLVGQYAELKDNIHKEEVEVSYVGLSGYNADVRELFVKTNNYITRLGEAKFQELLYATQKVVLREAGQSKRKINSAEVGNELRSVSSSIELDLIERLNSCLGEFRVQMLRIQQADDKSIFQRSIQLTVPSFARQESDGLVPKSLGTFAEGHADICDVSCSYCFVPEAKFRTDDPEKIKPMPCANIFDAGTSSESKNDTRDVTRNIG